MTHLPDDPILLKQMIAQMQTLHQAELEAKQADLARIGQTHQADLVRIGQTHQADLVRIGQTHQADLVRIGQEHQADLIRIEQEHKAAIDALLRRFYGPRSESFDPRQLLIFGLAMAESLPVDPETVLAETGEPLVTRKIANRHKHGRGTLPAHLPRIDLIHDLPDDQKPCLGCHAPRACIGSEDSEQLEFIPASFKVIVHKRMKYACTACDTSGNGARIVVADKPEQPIARGLPGPGLLAHVIVSKFADHLPVYRQEQIFQRIDVHIARSTICAWMLACSDLVKPLVDRMSERIRQSMVIHTDDTTIKVQDAAREGAAREGAAREGAAREGAARKGVCRTGRMWCYLGDASHPYDVLDFSPDRKREHPKTFLGSYEGYLQADAYSGYDRLYAGGKVTEVACWAHARRKFFEARETDGKRSTQMLEYVRQLYVIEQETRALTYDARQALRQSKSRPILDQMKVWLDSEQPAVLPRSPMGEAFTYTLNQWRALTRYIDKGYLNIDNNAAERALKRVAIGRKNWLFAGNDAAGHSHARLYTLIASAQRHGLNPQAYLMSVLSRLGQTKLSELDQFLPDRWKADLASEAAKAAQANPTASGTKIDRP